MACIAVLQFADVEFYISLVDSQFLKPGRCKLEQRIASEKRVQASDEWFCLYV